VKNAPLAFPFFLALAAFLFCPLFFPSIRLAAFAPFLAIVLKRKTLLHALWIAVLSGLIVDLCNSDLFFGFFALSYGLAAAIAYLARKWFTLEVPPSFAIYTALISALCSLIQLVFLSFPFQPSALFSNLFLMPLADGLYAFFWFTCPMLGYTAWKKRRRSFFR